MMILTGLVVAIAVMVFAWVCSVRWRNATVVERAWGLVFVALALAYATKTADVTARTWLVIVMIAIWGVRLSAYITWRGWGRGEDWRHVELRAKSRGRFALRSLFELFIFQAIAA